VSPACFHRCSVPPSIFPSSDHFVFDPPPKCFHTFLTPLLFPPPPRHCTSIDNPTPFKPYPGFSIGPPVAWCGLFFLPPNLFSAFSVSTCPALQKCAASPFSSLLSLVIFCPPFRMTKIPLFAVLLASPLQSGRLKIAFRMGQITAELPHLFPESPFATSFHCARPFSPVMP